MACPKLWVDLKKIEENARIITSLCAHRGIAVAGVVKGCRADEKVTQAHRPNQTHSPGLSRCAHHAHPHPDAW